MATIKRLPLSAAAFTGYVGTLNLSAAAITAVLGTPYYSPSAPKSTLTWCVSINGAVITVYNYKGASFNVGAFNGPAAIAALRSVGLNAKG